MSLRVGLAQTSFPQDGNVISLVEACAAQAEAAGVQLLVFPENLMAPKIMAAHKLRELAEPLSGSFAQTVCASAQRHGLWMVFTMMVRDSADELPYNTAVIVDDSGAIRGTYRQCHLYDAHGIRESDQMRAGDTLCSPIAAPFGTFGVAICYDLRFPEVARVLALNGCELIVYPSAWHRGPRKSEHWQTLLAARAIENECFVAGVCHAGSRYVGESQIIGPLGTVLAKGPKASEQHDSIALVVADIDLAEVEAARDAMPVFEHRRKETYRSLC